MYVKGVNQRCNCCLQGSRTTPCTTPTRVSRSSTTRVSLATSGPGVRGAPVTKGLGIVLHVPSSSHKALFELGTDIIVQADWSECEKSWEGPMMPKMGGLLLSSVSAHRSYIFRSCLQWTVGNRDKKVKLNCRLELSLAKHNLHF
jgi:hypothetical protein